MESFTSIIEDAKCAVRVSEDALAKDIVGSSSAEFDRYARIYYSSNEYLNNLFSNFSVNGKNVLCVAGSGDHAFECINRGASNVDIFDINKLAKYYFYLRKWGIKNFGSYYPDIHSLLDSHDWIKTILKRLDLSSITEDGEKEAFYFWSLYTNEQEASLLNRKLFYLSRKPQINEIKNTNRLSSLLDGKKISFTLGDICSGSFGVSKKYDLIIMSNILEYCNGNRLVLNRACNRLHSLLNDNGRVICSRLIQHENDEDSNAELAVFEEMFDKEEFEHEIDPILGKKVPVGYAYIKR